MEPGLPSTQLLPAVDPNRNIANGGEFTLAGLRYGRHVRLSPEIVVGMVKAIDFFLVVGAGAAAFALYLGLALHSAADEERYFLTAVLAATAGAARPDAMAAAPVALPEAAGARASITEPRP